MPETLGIEGDTTGHAKERFSQLYSKIIKQLYDIP